MQHVLWIERTRLMQIDGKHRRRRIKRSYTHSHAVVYLCSPGPPADVLNREDASYVEK